MICSLILSAFYVCLANAQSNAATSTESDSSSQWKSDVVSTPVYGTAHAYPTAVPSDLSYADLPEIICSISCSTEDATATWTKSSQETANVSKRSSTDDAGNQNSTANDGSASDGSALDGSASDGSASDGSASDGSASDGSVLDGSLPIARPGNIMQDGFDANPDCFGPRVRPIAPSTPWGWPSAWKSQRQRPYLCYYHAATIPECKNIHDQAVATYCPKSPRPRLCKARACQVLDQCKAIISSGRGYCWNPRWFVA